MKRRGIRRLKELFERNPNGFLTEVPDYLRRQREHLEHLRPGSKQMLAVERAIKEAEGLQEIELSGTRSSKCKV